MQTLKTAAIIVLLMTVMYTAYMSLTTPPDSLPPEVERIVMDEGGFDIESGLPESLGALEINGNFAAPTPQSASQGANTSVASQSDTEKTFGASFNDLPNAPQSSAFTMSDNAHSHGAPNSGVSIQLSDDHAPDGLTVHQPLDEESPAQRDLTPKASLASASTSMPPGSASPIDAAGESPNYQSTDLTFSVPDPLTATSDFKRGDSLPLEDSAPESGTAVAELSDQSQPATGDKIAQVSGAEADPRKNNTGLANALKLADEQYQADQRKEALETLSLFYHTPNVPSAQRQELLNRLDPLAAEVIYSKRHLLEQPHRVGHHETLMQIAVKYEVPWQLLANINGIEDPITVLPGTELKVVRGPFRADVDITEQEMTLFLGDLYAGRFPIAVGSDPHPKPGTFTVQDKQSERPFYGPSGAPIPANSPENPYGSLWLDLGGQLCIHGSPYATKPTEQGCISVAADYADDLYGILTQGSSVTIRR
ncbi:L,D-transpeptidase catalytic domain [Novipirellula galeiformis]|uniref:L,D-transpeptidase catalytic domain n=1 Tax=Novipirellula galeiformis TaxID=2528004 RepID=A0A5C6C0G3_9BACT|nr:L,D-transpeptidase family protein [Novipirellula galeiformis]TWU17685.1 L,D-transpeptidase catalytic domain [Novipirellula galeiformis]